MNRLLIFIGVILLVAVKIMLCVGILLFLIVFSPILLLGDENRFLGTIQRLHEYVTD